jgi:hypothetical protein
MGVEEDLVILPREATFHPPESKLKLCFFGRVRNQKRGLDFGIILTVVRRLKTFLKLRRMNNRCFMLKLVIVCAP